MENDPEHARFVQTFISRYVSRGRPLSGYFIICCITEVQWTILVQALMRSHSASDVNIPEATEAAAANRAWQLLLRHSIKNTDLVDGKREQILRTTMTNAMEAFSNLLVQIESLDVEPSEDSYAWETMSESLVVSIVGLSLLL